MSKLDHFFKPKSIAVIGATETQGSVGKTVISNLIGSRFKGEVYPVHPKREMVMQKKCYKSVKDIEGDLDLAIIITPANTVPNLVEECAQKKVKGAIIISAGFKELGEPGLALEKQIMEAASKSGLRIIGPNCLGLMNPAVGLNATFSSNMAQMGNLAFISQSGALCTAVLDWSFTLNIGFSAFVSIGSMLDIDWGDLIEYLNEDEKTEAIFIYMESIGKAKSFLQAAKKASLKKPVIVIKGGRSDAAAEAAVSHTGSLAGSDKVATAAFEQVGVIQAETVGELFNLAKFLSRKKVPQGGKLNIITNAGGPGVLAIDALVASGGETHKLSQKTVEKLNQILPAAWSHSNPIDVLGDADALRYEQALEILQKDDESDATLVILTPQDMTEPFKTAEYLLKTAKKSTKPILASWMGGESVKKADFFLQQGGVPTYDYPDQACHAFGKLWQYKKGLELVHSEHEKPPTNQMSESKMRQIIKTAQGQDRDTLTEFESKAFLSFGGILTPSTKIATTKEGALAEASEMKYPLVLKLHSETITHKSDVGGVKLNLKSKREVAKAFDEIKANATRLKGKKHFGGVSIQPMISLDGYEIILGSSYDPQMGPVILFGMGGKLVEVYQDSAIFLPPLTKEFAMKLINKTKIYQALKGVRGEKGVDLQKLQEILVRFSYLLIQFPQIKECDINPLLVSSEKIIALDARIVLHSEGTSSLRVLP